ncbi:MAG: SDR family oxidoreductase [Chitinivibrionales bacterium]|nr:SDR family oxidoreductase [Chitinivibrionales bacterium]MBD3356163.1 SDR family oxidoreductase [Chitinivibrionales bacterium]
MTNNLFNKTGKRALVTGENTGIGLGIAQGPARAEATVCMHGRNAEECTAAREKLQEHSPASKDDIRRLVGALAVDWASHGIRVNGIGPGYIQTDMTVPLVGCGAFNEWVTRRTPHSRWGTPSNIEGAAVSLSSGKALIITGHILYIGGGWPSTFKRLFTLTHSTKPDALHVDFGVHALRLHMLIANQGAAI